jgi:hypothetical protein
LRFVQGDVRVDRHRDLNIRMTDDIPDHMRRDAEVEQERHAGMAEVMKPPESRVLGVKVGLSCEFGSGSHFELVEAAHKLLQLGDPAGAGPDNLEHPGQPRTV